LRQLVYRVVWQTPEPRKTGEQEFDPPVVLESVFIWDVF
jgi:hypothetical protein